MTSSTRAIGIDLGTTYSCLAIPQSDGTVTVIPNDQGRLTTPSYVSFIDNQVVVGSMAKSQAVANLENTVFDAKRLMGRFYDDPFVQADKAHWPFKVEAVGNRPKIKVRYDGQERLYAPEQISSMILFKMKKLAEDYLGHPVTKAVITVPSYFNNSQRQATKDAGQIAGLEVLRIISEPTAAALAYGLKARSLNEGRQNLLVFDLGGGTFDVTVLVIEGGIFDVRATAGDTHLGGEDFDNRLVELGVSKFAQTHGGRNLKTNKRALRRLRNACEQAKLALSTAERTSVELDSLFEGLDLRFDVERAQFEDICDDLFRKTLEHVGRALSDSGLAKQDIHQVLLVGGSTRIPKVQQLLRQYFGREDLNLSINPDEAVARGAAVQAAMLCGEASMGIRDVLDVTPLSLGTALVTGDFSVIIGRNTRIPTTQTGNYYTVHPKQNAALIEVRQGEEPRYEDNTLLGEFILSDLPETAWGENNVDVTFAIDRDGILTASAVFRKTGTSGSITIGNYSHLAREEIERMTREAEEQRQRNAGAESRSRARREFEAYVLQVKRDMARARLDASQRTQLAAHIERTLAWIEDNASVEGTVLEDERINFQRLVENYLPDARGVAVR